MDAERIVREEDAGTGPPEMIEALLPTREFSKRVGTFDDLPVAGRSCLANLVESGTVQHQESATRTLESDDPVAYVERLQGVNRNVSDQDSIKKHYFFRNLSEC